MVRAVGTGSQHLWDLDQVLERGVEQQGFKEKAARSAARVGSEDPLHFWLGPKRALAGSAVECPSRWPVPSLCLLHGAGAPLFWEDSLVLL